MKTVGGYEIEDALADEAFQTLDEKRIDRLRSFGEEREIAAGDSLFEIGEVADHFHVVLTGEVRIWDPRDEVAPRPGSPTFGGEATRAHRRVAIRPPLIR